MDHETPSQVDVLLQYCFARDQLFPGALAGQSGADQPRSLRDPGKVSGQLTESRWPPGTKGRVHIDRGVE